MTFHRPESMTRRQILAVSALVASQIAPGKSVIAFSLQGSEATAVSNSGFANPEHLLDVEDFQEWAEKNSAQFVAMMPESSFDNVHIPDSIRFDWPDFDLPDTPSRELVESWSQDTWQMMAAAGLDADRAIAMYDDGTMFAARLWWVLELLGFGQKSVLNGGIDIWNQRGSPVESGLAVENRQAVSTIGATPTHWNVITLLPEAAESVGDPNVLFLDVRGAKEYREGHIPGAINLPYTLNAVEGEPGIWKSQDELISIYTEAGISPERRIVPYCSTGVRSAVTWFTLRILGYEDVTLFTGSWREWSSHPELPVTRGDNP